MMFELFETKRRFCNGREAWEEMLKFPQRDLWRRAHVITDALFA